MKVKEGEDEEGEGNGSLLPLPERKKKKGKKKNFSNSWILNIHEMASPLSYHHALLLLHALLPGNQILVSGLTQMFV